MRAYLMSTQSGLWMTFGEDAVEASRTLPVEEPDKVSVSGSFKLTEPIDLYRFWPYFTNSPCRTESK